MELTPRQVAAISRRRPGGLSRRASSRRWTRRSRRAARTTHWTRPRSSRCSRWAGTTMRWTRRGGARPARLAGPDQLGDDRRCRRPRLVALEPRARAPTTTQNAAGPGRRSDRARSGVREHAWRPASARSSSPPTPRSATWPRRYDLTQIAISGLSPEAEPSPARIAEVQDEAREHEITTIFYETLVSPAVATSIAGDLGLKTDVLDPIEGITADSRGNDYLAVMRVQPDRAEEGQRMPLTSALRDPRRSAPPTSRSSSAASRCCAASRCPCGAGEAVALLGGNGSGKSTLVRALLGLTPSSAARSSCSVTPLRSLPALVSRSATSRSAPPRPSAAPRSREVVASGRLALRRPFVPPSRADRAAVTRRPGGGRSGRARRRPAVACSPAGSSSGC